MSRHGSLRLIPLVLPLFMLLADQAEACSCLPPPTVLDEFVKSEIVIVASLQGFEEIDRRIAGTNVYRTYAAIMTVDKVYKGDLREGNSIRIYNGGGGDCSAGFDREKIGEKFLFFMGGPRKIGDLSEQLYLVNLCSRSKRFEDAAPDLQYLDNRARLEGKTRLSGRIRASGENITLPSVANLKLSISGPRIQRELETDSRGFFEIWDLPSGIYTLTIQLPNGWKMGRYRIISSNESGWHDSSGETIRATVVARKHTEVDTFLRIDNEISGRVFSPEGTPVKGVCVSAYWLTPTSSTFRIPDNCTNEKGEFKIAELPPGKYRLQVNSFGKITSTNPFETFYYPGVDRKEDAEPLIVQEGVSVRDLIIRVKATHPLIKISGRLTLEDGRPMSGEEVRFEPVDKRRYEEVNVETDKNGNFILEIPIGAEGRLSAETNIFASKFEECLAVKELRKTRVGRGSVSAFPVNIAGRTSMENVNLVLPFICNKK